MNPDIRIIFHHPEKTGGRSTVKALLTAVCDLTGWPADKIKDITHRTQSGQFVSTLPPKAGSFYLVGPDAFLHASHHSLPPPAEPDGIFHIIQFREPMARIISNFRMLNAGDVSLFYDRLMDSYQSDPSYRQESWRDFAENCPLPILERQIDMLDPDTHDPIKAMEVLARMDHVVFLDRYEEGIRTLRENLDLPTLRPHCMGTSLNTRITAKELLADTEACDIIRERAAKEFEFWNLLLEWRDA